MTDFFFANKLKIAYAELLKNHQCIFLSNCLLDRKQKYCTNS